MALLNQEPAADTAGPALAGGGRASKNRSPAPPRQAEGDGGTAVAPAARRGREEAAPAAPVVRPYVVEAPHWTTRVVTSDAEFEALEPAWRDLLAECREANVFLSHEWLWSWWQAYRPDATLALVAVEDRGRLRGIAPLMIQAHRRAGVRARVLRFVGDGTGETDHVDFVVAAADRPAVLAALLDAIDALPWDVAEFNQIPEQSPNAATLLEWLERQGLDCAIERAPCPITRLPDRYDALLARLPSRLRTSIRSTRRKLAEKHALEFGLHEEEAALPAALEAFFANHESRWQEGKGQAGAFSNPRRRALYARLTPRLLERGWLRFYYLKLDGRVVAQQYCFAVDGTVMLLQEGFDYAHAQDNVGNALRSHVFEHLIAQGAQCYDFLAGTSRHKQSWSDGTVDDLRIACGRRSLRGRLFFALPQAWKRTKDRLRPLRDRLLKRTPDPA